MSVQENHSPVAPAANLFKKNTKNVIELRKYWSSGSCQFACTQCQRILTTCSIFGHSSPTSHWQWTPWAEKIRPHNLQIPQFTKFNYDQDFGKRQLNLGWAFSSFLCCFDAQRHVFCCCWFICVHAVILYNHNGPRSDHCLRYSTRWRT